jgi:hypothetical protein
MMINTATLGMEAICVAAIAMASTAYAQAQRRTATVKHAPIVSPGDVSESWSPRQNIIDRKQYEQLLPIYG